MQAEGEPARRTAKVGMHLDTACAVPQVGCFTLRVWPRYRGDAEARGSRDTCGGGGGAGCRGFVHSRLLRTRRAAAADLCSARRRLAGARRRGGGGRLARGGRRGALDAVRRSVLLALPASPSVHQQGVVAPAVKPGCWDRWCGTYEA